MAGFNTNQAAYNSQAHRLHLQRDNGDFIYARPKGDSFDAVYLGEGQKPKKGDLPCCVLIRNRLSPDADAFCKRMGLEASLTTGTWISPKQNGKDVIPTDEVMNIHAARLIAGFENIPYDDENGNSYMLEYTDENALDFIRLFPYATGLISAAALNPVNFPQIA